MNATSSFRSRALARASTRPILRAVALTFALLAAVAPARAHPLTPASVLVRETRASHYRVEFRRGELTRDALRLELPSACAPGPARETREGDRVVSTFELRCDGPLRGRALAMRGLAGLSLGAIMHVALLDGEVVRGVLSPEHPSFIVPARSTAGEVVRDYVLLGVTHLLTGLDHVLFVLGLLWLVRGPKAVLVTLTAFTLGHSVTLCLAALSLVRLPQAPVEVGIALSLVVLALELVHGRARELRPFGHAFWLAAAFGLLHGFGFAGALAETGLPHGEVPLALFAFNLGVELAQTALVACAWPLLLLADRLARSEARVRFAAAYSIGSLSAMWCIERALALF